MIAVDKRYAHGRLVGAPSKVKLVGELFEQYAARKPRIAVAFVSWPEQYSSPESLVETAPVVVYVGCNFDGTACGSFRFWHHLVRRDLLVSYHDRVETMLIYGPYTGKERELVPEEYAAVHRSRVYSYGSLDGRLLF